MLLDDEPMDDVEPARVGMLACIMATRFSRLRVFVNIQVCEKSEVKRCFAFGRGSSILLSNASGYSHWFYKHQVYSFIQLS
jgi:hypothetical protein